jgi:preprotein translocase subunit YajC
LLAALIFLQAETGTSPLSLLLTFGPIFLIFYLIVIRPNQRQQKKHREMVQNLKNGDRVVTSGGVHGTVVGLRDDYVVLRVPPDAVKLEVQRSAVTSVENPPAETAS